MGGSTSKPSTSYRTSYQPQKVYDLICKKCGGIIRGVRLRDIDRQYPICAACDKCADVKTIQCSKCHGACTVPSNFIHDGNFICDRCGDLIREMMRNRALGGTSTSNAVEYPDAIRYYPY